MRLWVRPLASLRAEPVVGSEGSVSVFWSPDSRSIGFFAGGQLKRSDLRGEPPQILCDASDTQRPVGTWNREGVILFNSEDRRGLYRVPATGGQAIQVTALDASRQETLHAWPQFLPDGQHFIYLAQSERPENTGIYIGSLDSKVSKRVLAASGNPSYATFPSGMGYLLFMRAATLMAQAFDSKKLELRGEAFPVAEQVYLPNAPDRGFAAFSASQNGVLAYRTLGQASTELVWFDRQGRRLGTLGDPANYFSSGTFAGREDARHRPPRRPNWNSRHLAVRSCAWDAFPLYLRSFGRDQSHVVPRRQADRLQPPTQYLSEGSDGRRQCRTTVGIWRAKPLLKVGLRTAGLSFTIPLASSGRCPF